MGYVMSKQITSWIISATLLFSSCVYADTVPANSICRAGNTVVAFFNGVNTTPAEARDNLKELQVISGKVTPNGDPIEYSVMYNYTNGLEDFAETFEQRFKEEILLKDRWELFFQMLDDQGSWWDNIVNNVPVLIKNADNWRKVIVTEKIKKLLALLSNPPNTEQNYQEHRAKIDNWVGAGKKLLFVAHSQGNLFVNEAYRYATINQKISSDSVKVIHIAPASPMTNGPHILVDQDLVIKGLRLAGTVPSVTHLIPQYKFGGNNAGRDVMGHSLIKTYLNPAFGMYSTIKDDITQALNSLEAAKHKGKSEFLTVTMSAISDSQKKVYLYVREPTGYLVFSDSTHTSRKGDFGELEGGANSQRYVIGCDKTNVALGDYKVVILGWNDNNVVNKFEPNVTLQISSDADGVLLTKSFLLKNYDAGNKFNIFMNSNGRKYSMNVDEL